MLSYLGQWEDALPACRIRFVRVFQLTGAGKIETTGEVIKLTAKGEMGIELITDKDHDFVTLAPPEWGYVLYPLIEPDFLGRLVESLKLLDQPTVRYRLYDDNRQRAAIVREEITEPAPEAVRTKELAADKKQFCGLSPTGLHVRLYEYGGHLPIIGEQVVHFNVCRECGQVLADECFPK